VAIRTVRTVCPSSPPATHGGGVVPRGSPAGGPGG
jgi:hypothetical protein